MSVELAFDRVDGARPERTILLAGHWGHVDNPDGLLRKLLDYVGG